MLVDNAYRKWRNQAKWCNYLRYEIMDIKQKITIQINCINNCEDGLLILANVEYKNELIEKLNDLRKKIKIEDNKCKQLKRDYRLTLIT